ncbi:MAG: 23S rRNA (adenine(2503)-C(2))-methyltransferase RlmN [Acidimicrobiales bacterium]
MPGRYDATFEDVASLLDGEPEFRIRQLWDGLYRRAQRPAEMTDLPLGLREQMEVALPAALTQVSRVTADGGDTVKWLWSLTDGTAVETVLMAYRDRVTACVSTQAGCAMACDFCATGQAGFRRNLGTGEIVEQVIAAIREARPRRVSNIVFMGMGEPLANYDRTWGAVERLHAHVGISARHLTISTVGIVPGIRRLTAEALPVNLAVSLHAANDTLRDSLIPINRRYPLDMLVEACAAYVDASGRRLSFEWALIDGVNDRSTDVDELAALARPLAAHVNVIPLNPTPGYQVRGSPRHRVREFRDALAARGVNVTVRATRGSAIDAACGQLAGATCGQLAGAAHPTPHPARIALSLQARGRA